VDYAGGLPEKTSVVNKKTGKTRDNRPKLKQLSKR
jgi:hypothetical protein